MTTAPLAPRFRAVDLFPPVDVRVDQRADGTLLLRSGTPRTSTPPTLAAALADRAREHGERTLIAERDADGEWQPVSYAQAWDAATRIAGWLHARANATGRPERIMIVTGNSTAHALLGLGAALAGVPICPVSAQYALSSDGTYGRLAHVIGVVRPTIVFAERAAPIGAAFDAVLPADVTVICTDPGHRPDAIDWADVGSHEPLADPDSAAAALDPNRPLRYMLTSGSTGMPKVVEQTNRMWCSLFSGANAVLSHASGWGVRTLDWMPWSHVAGASVFIGALLNGGSFYLDDGRPTPELFPLTLRNIAEVQPLFFANVPYAFGMLCDAIEADAELCAKFFEHLQLCLYGGAGLTQPVYDRFQALAERTIGERIMFTTGYGCTEATSGVMTISWPTTRVGVGLPLPGLDLKLVPVDESRYEARFGGDCVMAGYLDNPDANDAAFDDEGYYRSGDTLAFHDRTDPAQGLVFAGRLAEEFKLSSGTFVRGGAVRAELITRTSPVVTDAVLCGEGRDELGALVWLNPAGCASVLGLDAPMAELARDPRVLDWLADRLHRPGARSAERIARVAVLVEPPSVDAGELSDKGSVNQAIARRCRAVDVERLYATGPGVRLVPAPVPTR